MSSFLMKAYKVPTFSDTSIVEVNRFVALNANKYKLEIYSYLPELTLDASPITADTTIVIITGYLNITNQGEYSLKIDGVGAGTYVDLTLGNDLLVYSTGTPILTKDCSFGFIPITIRCIKNTNATPMSFNVTIKLPGTSTYIPIPNSYKPNFGHCIFPFEVFEEISDSTNLSYKIIGEPHQNRKKYITSLPYKKFSVVLKQLDVYDRLDLKDFFYNLGGKSGTFWFSNRVTNYNVVAPIGASDTFFYIKQSFDLSVYEYITKYIYIEEISFISRIINIESAVVNNKPAFKVSVSTGFPVSITNCPLIQILSLCRFDSDTLTFELEDMNFSTVNMQLIELPNDYS